MVTNDFEASPVFTRWLVQCPKYGEMVYVDAEPDCTKEEVLALHDLECGLYPNEVHAFELVKWGPNMMQVRLGVTTCDKCGRPMHKGQSVITLSEGVIAKSNDELDFQGSSVRYACHIECWDGIEETDDCV
ncbi:MAG: hypothetical protein V1849_02510 [Chloroflexota bacterium]